MNSHYKVIPEPAIYFEGKAYPVSIYMQAHDMANHDTRLMDEIDKLEKKYIKLHLDQLMKEEG